MAEHATSETGEPGTETRVRTGRVITDVGFVKVGGAAELVAVGMVVASLAVSIAAGLPQPNPDPTAMGAWLSDVDAAGGLFRATVWLFVADHFLEIVFVVALYRLLRDAGSAVRFGLVASVLGLALVAFSGIVEMGLIELAASYAATGDPVRSSVLASAVALDRVRIVLNLLGTVLAWGVGGALFSATILRTSVLPDWLGWLGLAFGAVVWLNLLRLLSGAFEPLVLVMLLVGLVWLPSMGVALLRIDPDRVPA